MSTKFKPGKSGNPKGRPKGIADRRTQWRDNLRMELPDLLSKLVQMAREGDPHALKLILDRVAPPLRPQAEPIDLPGLASAGTLTERAQAVVAAVAAGEIGTDAASDLLTALGSVARITEIDELAARVAALEKKP